jgi:N-ethylmaleimide reductase
MHAHHIDGNQSREDTLMPTLFDALSIGAVTADNRIWMAPLTRGRADRDGVPQPIMAEYYAQRASAGLIISEATGISRQGLGWPNAPGLWSDTQVEAWKPVTAAVHNAGGHIFAQLWHMGRLVHPSVSGMPNVSSYAIAAPGRTHTYDGKQEYTVPHALSVTEIAAVVGDYVAAARNAIRAGFDGVQIHGANGYLVDQFLRDNTNFRDDGYGGSPENRVRFLKEVIEFVAAEVGADRTALRLSPNGPSQGADDSNPESVFGAAAEMLAKHKLAFVELREQHPDGTFGRTDVPPLSPLFRRVLKSPLVLNGDISPAEAAVIVAEGKADAVTFGRLAIANPDLPLRIKDGHAFAEGDVKSWYSNGPEGYTDYPTWEQAQAAA